MMMKTRGKLNSILGVGMAILIQAIGFGGEADEALTQLLKQEWEHRLETDPPLASRLGYRRFDDRWPDMSPAGIKQTEEAMRKFLERLLTIDPAALSQVNQLNHALFRRNLQDRIQEYASGWRLLALNQRGGVQTANQVGDHMVFESEKDYENWLTRLRDLPTFVDQNIALMREGIAKGMIHPKVIMKRIPDQIAAQIVDNPVDSPFYRPFLDIPSHWDEALRKKMTGRAQTLIRDKVIPAYQNFKTFFENEYLPACLDKVGIWQLPNGKELYAFFASKFTTTSLTPEKIHEIGLREVQRIRTEMQSIIKKVGFEGDFDEFLTFLRTDSRFYYDDPQELLTAYQALSKRIDPELVRLFGRIPRIPYGVKPIPDAVAPDTTTAYYQSPAADGTRAGIYYVNLYKPEVRPKYEMEALSLHEAVPGHHFQIALAMELGELPEFRRYGSVTAFVEGWALYAESLGEEMGFYRDPYSKFGQLTYEMWRAVRLVVDTGIHDKGWSRERAIEFFKENAAKSLHDIVNEIDRYIAWPGQALAYKIGELKIKELRAKATAELGDRLDIRAFHDAILASGPVSLDVLENQMEAWIDHQK